MTEKESLISVIVPIYNVEDYLEKCLQSIIQSTYKNIEVILVDDGSTDNSGKICDKYDSKYSFVKVIHRNNGGLSAARNSGMEIAKGDYYFFVDSDDAITPDILMKLIQAAKKYDADVVQCGYRKVDENGDTISVVKFQNELIKGSEEVLSSYFRDKKYQVVVWNKLYKSELIKSNRFVEGKNNEDNMFLADIIYKIDTVYLLHDIGYLYLQRAGSIMGTSFSPKKMDAFFAVNYMLKSAKANFPNHIKDVICLECLDSFYLDYLIFKSDSPQKYYKYSVWMRGNFKTKWKKVKYYSNLSYKDKFRLNLYYILPNISFRLYDLSKKLINFNLRLMNYDD